MHFGGEYLPVAPNYLISAVKLKPLPSGRQWLSWKNFQLILIEEAGRKLVKGFRGVMC